MRWVQELTFNLLTITKAIEKEKLTFHLSKYTVHKNSNNFEDLHNGSNRRLAM